MNSNLIPEQRTDKNGRTVTRWVKPDSATSKSKPPLPAPTKAPLPQTPNLEAAFRRANLDNRGITVSDLDPRTAIAVESMLETVYDSGDTASMSTANDLVFGALKWIRDDYAHDIDYSQINNVGVFGADLISSRFVRDRMHMYVQGLHANNLFLGVNDFLLEATDKQREQAKALVNFANAAPVPWSVHYFGYDELDPDDSPEDHADAVEEDYCVRIGGNDPDGLSRFIMEHHDRVDEIITLVKERNNADVEMLREVIGHGEQALRQGLL